MGNTLKIAVNAFREAIREPIYFVMLYAALILIGILPGVTLFVFDQQYKMVIDSALATMLVFGLLAVIINAGNSIAKEMRNGTVLLLLSKPVGRWSFVLGKVAGIMATGWLFVAWCSMATYIALFVATDEFHINLLLFFSFFAVLAVACLGALFFNYWRGVSFAEFAVYFGGAALLIMWLIAAVFTPKIPLLLTNIATAMVLVNWAVSLMAVWAVAIALRGDTLTTLLACTMLFFVGLLSNYLFLRETGWAFTDFLCAVGYAVLPNWQYFWVSDAVALGRKVPWLYVGQAALYALLYSLVLIAWSIRLFQNQEAAGAMRQQ